MQQLAMNTPNQEPTVPTISNNNQHLPRLVLAESQPIIFHPLLKKLKKHTYLIRICSTSEELISTCEQGLADILVLGTLPDINCLEVYRKCRHQWANLPIILLVNQPVVNDFFKTWATKQGINGVVSSYPQEFDQLIATIDKLVQNQSEKQPSEDIPLPPVPPLEEIFSALKHIDSQPETIQLGKAIAALNDLTQYSNRYFGALVIGNYWNKARARVIESNPWLNEWSVDHWGKIEYLSNSLQNELLTIEQFKSLQLWSRAFMKECQRVVVDFPNLLRTKHLSPEIDLLISSPISSTR